MQNSIDHLEKELLNIRAGKANPSMLSSIKLDYYGAMTLLSQLANINTPDSQTISIQPWEKDKLQDIEKAMMLLIPEAWEKNISHSRELTSFYDYHANYIEPWDGPAAIAATDISAIPRRHTGVGTKLGTMLAQGWRPAATGAGGRRLAAASRFLCGHCFFLSRTCCAPAAPLCRVPQPSPGS